MACLPEEIQASTQTRSICVQLVPHSDLDPDGVLFEQWAGRNSLSYQNNLWVTSEGTVMGASDKEDSAIWSSLECVMP